MNTKHQSVILEHHTTVRDELLCHLPYAIFSVALSLVCLSLLSYTGLKIKESKQLFHSFHFLHILFAGTGAVLAFRKYSKNLVLTTLVGCSVPAVFCTLSDSLLPFLGGWYLELGMQLHWCFIDHFSTVLPFLVLGVVNGIILSSHPSTRRIFYSNSSHFFHIFLSSLASLFYLVSYGFTHWGKHIGFIFLFLIVAVLIPCTFSDIIVPMSFARYLRRHDENPCEGDCHEGAAADSVDLCIKGEEDANKAN